MTIALFLPADPTLASSAVRLGDALRRVRAGTRVIAVSNGQPAAEAPPDDAVYLIAAEVLPLVADLPLGRSTVLLQDVPDAIGTLGAALRIIVPSEVVRSGLIRDHRNAAERIAIVPPGIDPRSRSDGSGSATCRILSVGNLLARKGHMMLVEALNRLSDLDWSLCIAAADLEAPRERAYADALRDLIEACRLTDRFTFSTGPDWQGADLFALASQYEAYGCAIAEALRRGLPVAVTNVGCVPTLVGPEAGVVCAAGDVDQMSKALRRVIFDAKLRSAMADIAWQTGQALPSWQDQAEIIAEMIA